MWPIIIATTLGALKGEQDKAKEKKQRLVNAEIARYSPWTRLAQEEVKAADPTGSVMQGAISGAMMDQSIKATNAQNKLLEAQAAGQAAPTPGYMPGQGMPPYANAATPWPGVRPYY